MLLFSSAYSEYTVISNEYKGPLDFDITGVYSIQNGILMLFDCSSENTFNLIAIAKRISFMLNFL